MLFAAGVGIDMLFYSVTGPITQYITPPAGEGQTAAAVQDAVVWTMFHYGIAGWAMYALLGMAMGYFAYRWGMPLSIRAALYPLLGKRVRGGVGDVIDIVALVGTVFGVATSMGIGVVLLNVGFALIFGLQQGLALQIALVLVAVVLTIAACTSGVDRGIRWISELNIWSAAAMLLYILVTGQTSFLLNAMVENIGRFLFTLPDRTLQTFAYEDGGSEWMASWTLFFWAFWLAWGPFVGLFLARISRGRTLREFVIAAITAPVLCDFLIVCIFGNSAMHEVLNGNTEFAQLAVESPEQGWYALLDMFPGAGFLIGLGTLSGLLVLPHQRQFRRHGNVQLLVVDPGPVPGRCQVAAHLLGCAHRAARRRDACGRRCDHHGVRHAHLRPAGDDHRLAGHGLVLQGAADGAGRAREARSCAGRRRRRTAATYPSARGASGSPGCAPIRPRSRWRCSWKSTAQPALADVRKEFTKQGYQATLDIVPNEQTGISSYALVVTIPDHRDFHYQVQAVEAPVPMFGGRMSREIDVYYRVEVFAQTGSEGYDLMGVTHQQIIDDVLDRYEAHLGFLTYSTEHDYASVLTPPVPPATGSIVAIEPVAVDAAASDAAAGDGDGGGQGGLGASPGSKP